MIHSACDDILALIAASPRTVSLSDDAKDKVRIHLDSCETCRDKFSTVVAVGDCLAPLAAGDPSLEINDAEIEGRVRAGVGAAMAPEAENLLRFRPAKPRRIGPGAVFAFLGVSAAAACLALFVFWPSGSPHGRYIVAAGSMVESGTMGAPEEFFRITVELKNPAFVRLAVRDCRGAIALAPNGVSTGSTQLVSDVWHGSVNAFGSDDSQCHRTHVFVLAGAHAFPEEAEILLQTPANAVGDALERSLQNARTQIQKRFGCDVYVLELKTNP